MNIRKLILISTCSLLMASCSTTKHEMVYFSNIDNSEVIDLGDYSVKIEPGDDLFISVTSENPQASASYNLPFANPAMRGSMQSSATPRQLTYTVDPEGYIMFPVLGKLYVKGYTTEQLRDMLIKQISVEVEDPIVTVELVDYYVDVVGEVNRAGRIGVYSPRFSILDALAQAGDLNQYGRRDNILLIREEDGKRKHVRLDLTSADILSSPYFYLKQNDYIYVEPNDIRKDNAEYNQYNSYKLQVTSVLVSASVSIISLIIAFAR